MQILYNKEILNQISKGDFTEIFETDNIEEGAGKICCGKYVIYDPQMSTSSPYNFPCTVYEIPHYFGLIWMSLSLKRNSPFTKIFNQKYDEKCFCFSLIFKITPKRFNFSSLIRFRENGFQSRMISSMNGASFTSISDFDSFQPIKIEAMSQVISIAFIGILLSMIVIVIEIINERNS